MTSKHAKVRDDISDQKDSEDRENQQWIERQFRNGVPVQGTPGEKYFKDFRKITSHIPSSIVWNPAYQSGVESSTRPSLLSAVQNEKGELVAIQALQLNATTGAPAVSGKTKRYSKGRVKEGFVFLGNPKSLQSTLVIGEGVETVLTRNTLSPCDGYASLGKLRFVKPKSHHKRIEILADNDKRQEARSLAKQYGNANVHIIIIPERYGEKADLNDVLKQSNIAAVGKVVEDAEKVSVNPRNSFSIIDIKLGSDIEIAQCLIMLLEEIYGPVINAEGKFWYFNGTYWVDFDNENLARFIHRVDGARYPTGPDKFGTVKLSKSRVNSILDAIFKYNQDRDFFKNTPVGINAESGFIKISADGSLEQIDHARQLRQRHVVKGKWTGQLQQKKGGYLDRYLNDAFLNDEDKQQKIDLVGEVLGCAATSMGTKLKNPKAIVAYSGKARSGKSAFLKLLRAMPNAQAVSSVSANKFGDEYYAHRLIGKVLNASDELSDKGIRSDVFKKVITGEPITAREVYTPVVEFSPTAVHVFSTNKLPTFSGGVDEGVTRRLNIFEFNHAIPEDEVIVDIHDKILNEEPDELLSFAVEGASRLIRNGNFTIPPSSHLLLNHWVLMADPVLRWAKERVQITDEENVVTSAELYRDFEWWSHQQGVTNNFHINNIAFGLRLRGALPGIIPHRSNGSKYINVVVKKVGEP